MENDHLNINQTAVMETSKACLIDTAKNGVGIYQDVDFVPSFTDRGNLAGYAIEAYDTDSKFDISSDKGVVLGTVGPNYLLVKNAELIEEVKYALGENAPAFPSRLFWDGSRFAAVYSLAGEGAHTSIDQDDNYRPLNLSVLVRNSYNGSWKAEVRLMVLDMFCMNGMVVGKEFGAVSFRHSAGNNDWKEQLHHQLLPMINSAANGAFPALANKIQYMHSVDVNNDHMEFLFGKNSKANLGPTTIGSIMQRYVDEECRTLHGLFSAGTNVLWHNSDKAFSSNTFLLNERWVKSFNELVE